MGRKNSSTCCTIVCGEAGPRPSQPSAYQLSSLFFALRGRQAEMVPEAGSEAEAVFNRLDYFFTLVRRTEGRGGGEVGKKRCCLRWAGPRARRTHMAQCSRLSTLGGVGEAGRAACLLEAHGSLLAVEHSPPHWRTGSAEATQPSAEDRGRGHSALC